MPNTPKVVKLRQPTTELVFTDKSIANLKHRDRRYNAKDTKTGLLIRVSAYPSTLKVFTTEKWFKGSVAKQDIGVVGEVTLKDARAIHNKRMALLAEGRDFRFVSDGDVEYEKIGTLMRRILKQKSKAGKHTPPTTKLYESLLESFIPKRIQTKTFAELTKSELVDWYLDSSSPFSASNAKKLFNLAFNSQTKIQKKDLETPTEMLKDVYINTDLINRKQIYVNPRPDSNELGELIAHSARVVFGDFVGMFTEQDLIEAGKEVPKDFEPFEQWAVKPKEHYRVYLDAMLFILLTGLRAGKVYQLKWSQVDMDNGIITIKQTKRKEETRIEFTDQLYWLMTYRQKVKPHALCKWVFPSNKDLKKPITTIRDLMDVINTNAKLEHQQSPHSIRRTLSNVSAWLGYGKEVQDAILHHAPQGVGEVNYNDRMAFLQEQLQQCHNYIDNRFAEGVIAHHIQLPHNFEETNEDFTSVFGRLYGTKDRLFKDKDFYSDIFEPRTRTKKFKGDFIDED